MMGRFTVVYGCTWTNESVKMYKNNVLIDQTTSVKKSFTFDAEKDDVIEIRELYSVMVVYSIELLALQPEPEPEPLNYVRKIKVLRVADQSYYDNNNNELTVWENHMQFSELQMFVKSNFNKIRFIRKEDNGNIGIANIMGNELQLWINGINVAASANGASASSSHGIWSNDYQMSYLIDGNNSTTAHNENSTAAASVGSYFDVTLSNSYDVENIQSIVFYARPNYSNKNIGMAFQLLNNNTFIYEFSMITEGKSYYRYDGPKINEVSTFSTGFSATQIINTTLNNFWCKRGFNKYHTKSR